MHNNSNELRIIRKQIKLIPLTRNKAIYCVRDTNMELLLHNIPWLLDDRSIQCVILLQNHCWPTVCIVSFILFTLVGNLLHVILNGDDDFTVNNIFMKKKVKVTIFFLLVVVSCGEFQLIQVWSNIFYHTQSTLINNWGYNHIVHGMSRIQYYLPLFSFGSNVMSESHIKRHSAKK